MTWICRLARASLALLLGTGCVDHPSVNVAPVPGVDAAGQVDPAADGGRDTGAADAEAPKEAGGVRRIVLLRSPFGNLEHAGNLLMDGDFELSSDYGQSPWVALDDQGQVPLLKETGGVCRSGLQCLVLDHATSSAYGRGVTSEQGELEFWMWVHVPGDDCNVVWVALIRDMTKSLSALDIVPPESDVPGEHGWCRFHQFKTQENEAVGVYVEAELAQGQRVILDDAVLRPSDGLSPMRQRGRATDPARLVRATRRLADFGRRRFAGTPGPWRPGMPRVPGVHPPLDP